MVPSYAQVYLISFLYTPKYAQVCTSYTALSASSDAWPSGVFTIWLSTDLTHSSYFCDFENWKFEKQENMIFFKHWLFGETIHHVLVSHHTWYLSILGHHHTIYAWKRGTKKWVNSISYDSYRAFNPFRNSFSFSMIIPPFRFCFLLLLKKVFLLFFFLFFLCFSSPLPKIFFPSPNIFLPLFSVFRLLQKQFLLQI